MHHKPVLPLMKRNEEITIIKKTFILFLPNRCSYISRINNSKSDSHVDGRTLYILYVSKMGKI